MAGIAIGAFTYDKTPTTTHSAEFNIGLSNEDIDKKTNSLLYELGHRFHTIFVEPIMTGWRFLQLIIIFLPCILTIPVLICTETHSPAAIDKNWHVWWYNLLARQMERAGPSFIKVCLHYYIL
jgi:hypothetical protein